MAKPFPIAINVVKPVTDNFAARLQHIAQALRQLSAEQVRSRFQLAETVELLKTTVSLCPDCLQHVPAAVYAEGRQVLISKQCPQHGYSRAVLENDRDYYYLSSKDQWGRAYGAAPSLDIPAFAGDSCCAPGESCTTTPADDWRADFTDQRGNKSCTILLEVTDACNLACRVCYADAKGDRLLPYADFVRVIEGLLAQKQKLDSVQITGGEASLHPQFWELIDFLYRQPAIGKIYLPTNGVELLKQGWAKRLTPYRDKLLVLLQFDGREPVNQVLRQAKPDRIRQQIVKELARYRVPMQLTMTLAQGVSENDVAWVVAQGLRHRNVRLIAMQPATYSGRYDLPPDPMQRLTLSDVVKYVALGLPRSTRTSDFLPIPCSHPNCGWVTLYARRFGLLFNIARQVDLNAVMNEVAYKTLLNQAEMQNMIGTKRNGFIHRLLTRLGRRLIRPQDVFGIVIKPFMDRFSYDQDRVSACCHHTTDTKGQLVSFCEYNARIRQQDSWAHLPVLAQHKAPVAEVAHAGA